MAKQGDRIKVLANPNRCPDITVGWTYTVGATRDDRLFIVDDVGDMNYCISADPEADSYDGQLDDPGCYEVVNG